MRENGIFGRVRRRWRRTTITDPQARVAPNRLNQRFSAKRPDQVWVGDITYIRTKSGWAYLAVVIDLCTRLAVGWQLADHMRSSLIVDALESALSWRTPAKGMIFHSDRGTQYTSQEFRNVLDRHGITSSMSGTGNCYDNAPAESFFGTLKQEFVHHQAFDGQKDLHEGLRSFINAFYNRRRLHSSLGYMTPWEKDMEVV